MPEYSPLAPCPLLPLPCLQHKMHINDWAAIQTLFDKLNKQLERTQKATQSLGVPRAYVRMLCELEDFLNKTLAGAGLSPFLSFLPGQAGPLCAGGGVGSGSELPGDSQWWYERLALLAGFRHVYSFWRCLALNGFSALPTCAPIPTSPRLQTSPS